MINLLNGAKKLQLVNILFIKYNFSVFQPCLKMLRSYSLSTVFRRLSSTINHGQIPTIIELREAMLEHVKSVPNASTRFDPNKSHPVSASRTKCVIPLASNPEFQIRYLNASGHPRGRFGMILEDLDMFAVWLAFKHNQGVGVPMGTPSHHPMLIVTAAVDKIGIGLIMRTR